MLMPAVERYLALRRALGYTLASAEPLLHSFARYAEARGEEHIVRRTAQDWATHARTPRQGATRLGVLRGLACFLPSPSWRRRNLPLPAGDGSDGSLHYGSAPPARQLSKSLVETGSAKTSWRHPLRQ